MIFLSPMYLHQRGMHQSIKTPTLSLLKFLYLRLYLLNSNTHVLKTLHRDWKTKTKRKQFCRYKNRRSMVNMTKENKGEIFYAKHQCLRINTINLIIPVYWILTSVRWMVVGDLRGTTSKTKVIKEGLLILSISLPSMLF